MTPEYKAEKEASVTNLGGGGIWEINYVTLVAPAAYFLWSILQSKQGFFKSYTVSVAVCDFLLQCCAILFAITVYGSAPQILNGLLILPAFATLLQPSTADTPAPGDSAPKLDDQDKLSKESKDGVKSIEKDSLPIKPFITAYRGAMMIITCASILAVDFPVFPRRFAKTESFGTSLMDLGVGSFVFAAGIVAARQQLREQQTQMRSFVARMRSAMRHSTPLIILGFARLFSVKNLDYVEHVSEYGVHWNFFFTLALLPPAIAFLQPILRIIPSLGALTFVIGCIYEAILNLVPDLKRWIILSERIPGDFLSENREGVFSFIGYLGIFIAGMGIGLEILQRDPETVTPKSSTGGTADAAAEKDVLDEDADWLASVIGDPNQATKAEPHPLAKPELPKTTLAYLFKWTCIWFILCVWAMWRYGPHLFVSRRLANLAYILWVCAFNTAQLLVFCLIESLVFPGLYSAADRQTERTRIQNATSKVMKAFNRNGLAIFLLANILTGLINMFIPTLHMGDWESMAVLVGYLGTLTAFGLYLDATDISIKL